MTKIRSVMRCAWTWDHSSSLIYATAAACSLRTGDSSTGMPFSTALPGQRVDAPRRRAGCCWHPACAAATVEPRLRVVVAPAVRDADDARHDRVGHLDRHLDRAGAGGRPGARPPSASPKPLGVVGMHVQRAALLALHELRRRCASTSCWSAAGAGRSAPCRRCGGAPATARSRSTSATIGSGASSILPLGVRSTSGMRGSSGPRSMPCGAASSCREREPVGVGAEAGRRTARMRSIQSSTRSGPRRGSSACDQLLGVAAGERRGRVLQLALRRAPPTTKSSSASMSASSPWPAAMPASRSSVSHSGSSSRVQVEHRRRVVGDVARRRAGRARGRSASGRAPRAPAGSRRRGAWSR